MDLYSQVKRDFQCIAGQPPSKRVDQPLGHMYRIHPPVTRVSSVFERFLLIHKAWIDDCWIVALLAYKLDTQGREMAKRYHTCTEDPYFAPPLLSPPRFLHSDPASSTRERKTTRVKQKSSFLFPNALHQTQFHYTLPPPPKKIYLLPFRRPPHQGQKEKDAFLLSLFSISNYLPIPFLFLFCIIPFPVRFAEKSPFR